jgi:hypothetical protein
MKTDLKYGQIGIESCADGMNRTVMFISDRQIVMIDNPRKAVADRTQFGPGEITWPIQATEWLEEDEE